MGVNLWSPGWALSAAVGCPSFQPCACRPGGRRRTSSQLPKLLWCLFSHQCPSDCDSPPQYNLGMHKKGHKLRKIMNQGGQQFNRTLKHQKYEKRWSESGWRRSSLRNTPLRSGSSLFSSTSRASVPSSIKSSLVITPIVLRPRREGATKKGRRGNFEMLFGRLG